MALCFYCSSPVTKLCDYNSSLFAARKHHSIVGPDQILCDRPLCDRHAVLQETLFLCGVDGCAVETIDYCLDHDRKAKVLAALNSHV